MTRRLVVLAVGIKLLELENASGQEIDSCDDLEDIDVDTLLGEDI